MYFYLEMLFGNFSAHLHRGMQVFACNICAFRAPDPDAVEARIPKEDLPR